MTSPNDALRRLLDALEPAIHYKGTHVVLGEMDRKQASDAIKELRASPLSTSAPQSEKAEKYATDNPLGGPAKVFEAMASRIRAGEDYYSVLDDYDLQHKSPPSANAPTEGEQFAQWWDSEDHQLGPAHRMTAWNGWIARARRSPPSPAAAPDPYPDNEADGVVFCGKCGGQR